jgi:glycosyltransferase involved in cell wall biosynthesis
MNSIVIIPAFNPDTKLITLVEGLKQMNLKMVIVNDGSAKKSTAIFDILKLRFQCVVCEHVRNMGRGTAIKTGIEYASRNYPDCVGYVTVSADGQHAPEDIIKVADLLEENPDTMILGTRDFRDDQISLKTRIFNQLTAWAYFLSTRRPCLDTQTSLRGIPRNLTDMCLELRGNRHEYEMNMLLEVARQKIPVIEVEIENLQSKTKKVSLVDSLKEGAQIYLNILKFSLSSFLMAIVDNCLFTIILNIAFGVNAFGVLAASLAAKFLSEGMNRIVGSHPFFRNINSQELEILQYGILFLSQIALSWFFITSFLSFPLHLTVFKIMVDIALIFASQFILEDESFLENIKSLIK